MLALTSPLKETPESFDDILEETSIALEPYGRFPIRCVRRQYRMSLSYTCEVDIPLDSYSSNWGTL